MADIELGEWLASLTKSLVEAFVNNGRPVMPRIQNGVLRTEEFRDTLTRMMANLEFYHAYRHAILAAFEAAGVRLPLDRKTIPHVEYDDSEIAANGFANINDPDTLAALALDPSAFEGINQLLFEEIPAGKARPKVIGPWLRQAEKRWPVAPYEPPLWLREQLAHNKD